MCHGIEKFHIGHVITTMFEPWSLSVWRTSASQREAISPSRMPSP
jgi:hypothetical protein